MNFKSDSEVELRWSAPLNPDLEVVNAARVSFGKQKQELDDWDVKLINYLAKHKHMSPFYHSQFSFRIKTPEFVARQMFRHQIGIEYTSTQAYRGIPWNEISGRYVVLENLFYLPKEFREQSKSNRQASGGILNDYDGYATGLYKKTLEEAYKNYQDLLISGVAREQARALLPLAFYTEFIMTCSLCSAIHFIHLRDHEGAQEEVREVAKKMAAIIESLAPISFKALMENK